MRDYAAEAKRFKAFCDENRLKIIELLQGGELCACELLKALDMSQSTLSYHMKILCDAGVVINRQEGKWAHYRINPEGGELAIATLQSLTALHEDENACREGCSCGGK